MKIIIKVEDGAIAEQEAIEIEFFVSSYAREVFGDDIEVEIESGAENTECIFPDGTGSITEQAASILAAHFVAAVGDIIEEYRLPTFTVATTHADDSHPDSHTVYSYKEVLALYPWILGILPTTWDEIFSLSWTSGLTRTEITL